MTSGRHGESFPAGGGATSRRGEASSASGPGQELDALLSSWANERDRYDQSGDARYDRFRDQPGAARPGGGRHHADHAADPYADRYADPAPGPGQPYHRYAGDPSQPSRPVDHGDRHARDRGPGHAPAAGYPCAAGYPPPAAAPAAPTGGARAGYDEYGGYERGAGRGYPAGAGRDHGQDADLGQPSRPRHAAPGAPAEPGASHTPDAGHRYEPRQRGAVPDSPRYDVAQRVPAPAVPDDPRGGRGAVADGPRYDVGQRAAPAAPDGSRYDVGQRAAASAAADDPWGGRGGSPAPADARRYDAGLAYDQLPRQGHASRAAGAAGFSAGGFGTAGAPGAALPPPIVRPSVPPSGLPGAAGGQRPGGSLHSALLVGPSGAQAWSGQAGRMDRTAGAVGVLDEPDPGLLTHRGAYDGHATDDDRFGYPPDGLDPAAFPIDPDYDYPDPAGTRVGRHRRSGRRRRWLKVTGWIAAFVGLLGAAVGAWGFYQYRRLSANITRIDALAPNDPAIREAAKQRNAENFLLIGSDTRAGENDKYGQVSGARSDTTILAHLSPNRDKALLVSFPRDSWVDIPACQRPGGGTTAPSQGLFNSAFTLGGPKCTVLTVQKLTGISVNHYVQVDFAGFKTMVDALGGVTVCSTEDIVDKDSGLRLREGNQVLRGEQALAYVRARKALGDGSDLGRIERQQRFLGAMIRKATSSRVLFNPLALTRFLDAATKSLTLDRATSLGDLKGLADQLRNLDPKRVTFLTAPIANQDYSPPGTGQRGKVLLDSIAGRRLWDSIINDKPAPPKNAPKQPGGAAPKVTLSVAPADVPIRVLNGVGVQGLAARTAAELTAVGFPVAGTGNAPLGAAASVVRHAPDRLDAARTLAAAVPGAVLQQDASLGRTVVLVVGSSYRGATEVQVGQTVPAPSAGRAPPPTPVPGSTPAKPVPSISAADTRCT